MQAMSLALYGFEILGILRILRAGYVSGMSWFQKSLQSDEFCVQAMSLAFGAFGNPRK